MTFHPNLKTVSPTWCRLAVATVHLTSPMESEYQQFQFPASASFRFPHSVNLQTGKIGLGSGDSVSNRMLTHLDMCAGVKKTLVYVPYGLLLLLLIILLLLAGIKCA